MNIIENDEIKKTLEILKNKKGFHNELISLYIPYDYDLSFIKNHLKNEISKNQNIKSKINRKNTINNISILLEQLKNIKIIHKNGLIMFSGIIQEKNESYIINPSKKIKEFIYHCSNKFLLLSLKEMI